MQQTLTLLAGDSKERERTKEEAAEQRAKGKKVESGGEVAPLLLLTSHEQRAIISVSTLSSPPPSQWFVSLSSLSRGVPRTTRSLSYPHNELGDELRLVRSLTSAFLMGMEIKL